MTLEVEENLKIIRLEDNEKYYKELEKWYKSREVNTFFEQRPLSLDEIRNKYRERTKEDAKVPVYIINYYDKDIGIIQYSRKDQDTLEIDIFIGESNLISKGIGTKVVTYFYNYLLERCKRVIMCPLKSNLRAIRCYEKSGFVIKEEFKDKDTIGQEQIFVLMEKE